MKNKPGFHATILIIILLGVALLGAVGYIFWNNMNGNNKSSSNTKEATTGSSTETSNVALTNFSADSKLGYSLSLKYPSNWKIVSSFDEASKSQNISLTSPSGKILVKVIGGYSILTGFECGETNSVGKLSSFHYKNIAGLTDLVLLDELYTSNDTVTYLKTSVTYKNSLNNKQLGEDLPSCVLGRIGGPQMIQLSPVYYPNSSQTYKYAVLNQSDIILLDVQNSEGTVKSSIKVSDVESARSSSEYSQAEDILMSIIYAKP